MQVFRRHPARPLPASPTPPRQRRLQPRLSRRLRGRVAALGIVAAVMVALPLSQLLRRQQAELDQLAARHAVLNPIARAVDSERSLLQHGDVAARVLRGRPELESERRVRQGEVDDRLTALAVALATGPWERAVHESDALREDWSLLARRLLAHNLSADDSEQGHRLLVEQSLQVIDLLDQAQPGHATDEASAQAPAPRRARPTPASLQAEHAALDRRHDSVAAERRNLLIGLLALAAVALWLARPLWPRSTRSGEGSVPDDADTPSRPAQAEETGRLMARLRRSDASPSELPPDSRIGDLRQP